VTALTGSPIASTGIELPTRSAVTSDSVMILFSLAGASFEPGAGIASAPNEVVEVADRAMAANTTDAIPG
jgi:hypothetical protein